MTRRENFLKTLRHEDHERLPAYTVIDNFNYPEPLPNVFDMKKITSFTDPDSMVELSVYYGMDTLIRMVPSTIKVEYGPRVKADDIEAVGRIPL